MRITIDEHWRVDAESEISLPLPASAVWGQMRDLPRFLSRDPLHARVHLGPAPDPSRWPVGATVVLSHRFMGVGPDRVGRILMWREGRGFAVSDLSKRGVRRGFPHICAYEVVPEPGRAREACRLRIIARGRWTATGVPRWAVRAWLWWVLRATEHAVRAEMLAVARWRRRHLPGVRPAAPGGVPPAAPESLQD